MLVIEETTYLEHFGVKGMKWGVRKNRGPKSSKEVTKAAKANAKVALRPSTDARIDRMFGQEKIKYSELSSKSLTIKRGSEFYRTTKRNGERLQDMTYVSTSKEDRQRYKLVMASPRGKAKRSYSPTYEAVYKSTKALKSPSEKERFDAFVELLDAKEISVGRGGKKKITGREYLARSLVASKKDAKKLESRALGEKHYHDFVSRQHGKEPINSAYFNRIRSKGYNAVVDDNDRNIVSKAPLMVLDPSVTLKQISVRQLSNDEINKAAATLKPLSTIKPKA